MTTAMKVTGCPRRDGLCDEVSLIRVFRPDRLAERGRCAGLERLVAAIAGCDGVDAGFEGRG